MGLPLWQPPVESDIPSRPEAKNPVHARSRIRNTSTRDRGTAIRERPAARNGRLRSSETERRLALLDHVRERIESSGNNSSRTRDPASQDPAGHPRVEAFERGQQQLRDFIESQQPQRLDSTWPPPPYTSYGDEDVSLRHFGDWPERVREQLTSLRRLERETGDRLGVVHNTERFARASERVERSRAALEETRRLHERHSEASERTQRLRAQTAISARLTRGGAAAGNEASGPAAAAGVDGLGDRDRSLSPENDAAWDTLLTTVTPDPQPPSVGSSFASVLSADAYRSSAHASSGTSLTGPDTGAEESAAEQPCDSDDEVEYEVELGGQTNASIQSSGAPGDSYADAVRAGEHNAPTLLRTRNPPVRSGRIPRHVPRYIHDGTGSGINAVNEAAPGTFSALIEVVNPAADDLILQLVGGLGGMQHIVRNLVRREDIPNDWWVDAGLSRTLPRDDAGSSGSGNDPSNN